MILLGRATPLVWLMVDKDTLKNQRNKYEYGVSRRPANALRASVKVLILAGLGFGDQKLYRLLTVELKIDYLIRFRSNINVTAEDGETRPAPECVGAGSRAWTLRNAAITAGQFQVGTVMCVHAKGMREPRYLAASTLSDYANQSITAYGKRWTIEPGFCDTKDLCFGMRMGSIRVSDPQRGGRLWLLNAFPIALLMMLGAAGEAFGYDHHLKSNPEQALHPFAVSRRPHALRRHPNSAGTSLAPPYQCCDHMLCEIPLFTGIFGLN